MSRAVDEIKELTNVDNINFSYSIRRIDDSVIVERSRDLLPIDIIEILTDLFLMIPEAYREDIFSIVKVAVNEVGKSVEKLTIQ
jgi:hypothetical protein